MPMTPIELRHLLVTMLTGAAGGTEARWSEAIGVVRWLPLSMAPRSNWRVEPSGTAAERLAIDAAVKLVREQHPYVDQG